MAALGGVRVWTGPLGSLRLQRHEGGIRCLCVYRENKRRHLRTVEHPEAACGCQLKAPVEGSRRLRRNVKGPEPNHTREPSEVPALPQSTEFNKGPGCLKTHYACHLIIPFDW